MMKPMWMRPQAVASKDHQCFDLHGNLFGGRGVESMVSVFSFQEMRIRVCVCVCLMGVDLTDVYSPARITEVCNTFKLVLGGAFALQNGWKF